MSRLFELRTLPRLLGGQGDYDPAASEDVMLQRYDSPAADGFRLGGRSASESAKDRCTSSSAATSPTNTLSRSTSFESIADVYYSARNTPMPSRPNTPGNLLQLGGADRRMRPGQILPNPAFRDLRMTKAPNAHRQESASITEGTNALGLLPAQEASKGATDDYTTTGRPSQRKRGRSPSGSRSTSVEAARRNAQTPIERIKSLADFRLYLSPSKRANMDLLLGSDDESDADVIEPRTTAERGRKRPNISPIVPMRLSVLKTNPAEARSYSASLTRHHAQGLVKSAEKPLPTDQNSLPEPIIVSAQKWAEERHASPTREVNRKRSISAYDAATNPTFGYPTVVDGSALRPRYGRKRKRDLAKALLYLFLLRLASLREWVDVLLRSFGLSGKPDRSKQQRNQRVSRNPEMAFRQAPARFTSSGVDRYDRDGKLADRNFIWMIFTLVLLRGGIPLGWETTVSTVWDGWSKLKGTLMP